MSKPRIKLLACIGILAALTALGFALATAGDQAAVPNIASLQGAERVLPAAQAKFPAAVKRTWAQIEQAAAAEAKLGPVTQQEIPFRPTMPLEDYKALKADAAARLKAAMGRPAALSGPLAPPTQKVSFEGLSQSQSADDLGAQYKPPDTHGAVGLNHFVEVTNTHIGIFTKAGALARNVSLNAFFGYPRATKPVLFDPRCVYDRTWNRWIITADAFAESATVQFYFVAISTTSDPLGSYFRYAINMRAGFMATTDFWDYPMVGMDQDALIFTGNVFRGSAWLGATMFPIAKARLYNGLGASVLVFRGLAGTLAPPIVLDQNSIAVLAAAKPVDNEINLYYLSDASTPPSTSFFRVSVPLGSFYFPPASAKQPGTATVLDTLDSRFVNNGYQIGTSLFQVQTIDAGLPTPRWFEFNINAASVVQSGFFFRSGTSNDFNASIAVTEAKTAYVTWSCTDPPAAVNAHVRFSGRVAADPAGSMNSPGASPTGGLSTTFYTGFRWGDYSAVSIDPVDGLAWIVNERITGNNFWNSRIGKIGIP